MAFGRKSGRQIEARQLEIQQRRAAEAVAQRAKAKASSSSTKRSIQRGKRPMKDTAQPSQRAILQQKRRANAKKGKQLVIYKPSRSLFRNKSNPGSNRRQTSTPTNTTIGRSTAQNQRIFNKPQSSSNYPPLNSFANTKRIAVNSAQQSLRNNMKILRDDVARNLKLHGQWQLKVDQFTNDKKTKYMQQLPKDIVNSLKSLIRTTKNVYSAGSPTFGKPAQVTVFDYDDNYHILSVNLLRVLSLWYSTLSFMTDEECITMGKQLRPLVKDVHTLFVLSTSANYFATEVAMYLQNPRSEWKARLEKDKDKYREIQNNKYEPFLSLDIIKRFHV